MREFFYVNKNADDRGDHEIHRNNCQRLPLPENRVCLGSFESAKDALEAARRLYPTADGCFFCCHEIHSR